MANITLAIPTIGRVETLPITLNSVLFQTAIPAEVLILDEAKTSVMETYTVSQALDAMSLERIEIKVIRDRIRKGIGPARYRLANEARHQLILMVDDDVVLRPNCLEELIVALTESGLDWTVPTCFLVGGSVESDAYYDFPISRNDHRVRQWTDIYPWFVPYFRYTEDIRERIVCSGTQAILLKKDVFLDECVTISEMGALPREDTLMTSLMGPGIFTSRAECLHYEHPSQIDRGGWTSSMFYRLHTAAIESPKKFAELLRKKS